MFRLNDQAEPNKIGQKMCPKVKREKLRIDVEFELGNDELSGDMISHYYSSLKSCWEYVIVNTRNERSELLSLDGESGKDISGNEDSDEAA